MRETGLKPSQYSVLSNLSEEPQSMGQLANRLEMDRTTLTRSLKPLLANGWVIEVARGDARQRLIRLTPQGQTFRQRAYVRWSDAQLALEDQLGRDVVTALNAQMEQALSKLKPALQEDNGR